MKQLILNFILKMNSNNIYRSILWYSILTICVGILLNLMSILDLLIKGEFTLLFPFILYFVIKIACLLLAIGLLKGKNNRYLLNYILFYWLAQILFFGFLGNEYTFTTGPQLAIYFRFEDAYVGYFTKYWTQEFTLRINSNSDLIYYGLNTVPLLITIALAYVLPSAKQSSTEEMV